MSNSLSPDNTNTLPKVIFLDAMGTLFGLKTSVGEIYQQYALKYGVEADAKLLDRAFIASFKSAPPLAFLETESATLEEQEFSWWKNVVRATFLKLNLLEQFDSFTDFFSDVYNYFAIKDPWFIFPDVVPALNRWQSKGIELGVISNFDTRLNKILNALELKQFFTTVTISSEVGFAKPDPNIFQVALNKHNVTPQQAWHIGDSLIEDYQGAKRVEISAFCLNRDTSLLKIENPLPNLSSLG